MTSPTPPATPSAPPAAPVPQAEPVTPTPPPRLLALDTATEWLAAGLLTPRGRWLHHEAGAAQASARLLPVLMDLLRQGGETLAGLDAIAFGVGPGAFTGLRTACAVAQGLGFGAGRPLLPIDSLLLVAEAARASQAAAEAGADAGPWWVAVDARMDEVYAAEYRFDPAAGAAGAAGAGGGWQTCTAPALYTLAALAGRWAQAAPRRVAGNGPRVFGARLPLHGARCIEPAEPVELAGGAGPGAGGGRAGALLTLARAAWARGEALAAEQALPLYLRDKVALTTDERLRQRAATAPGDAR